MNKIKRHLGWMCKIVVLLCASGCSYQTKEIEPEQKLLNLFMYELELLNEHQDDYVGYMQWQIENFSSKQTLTNELIEKINSNFQEMTEETKREYQVYWSRQFQEVVDGIYTKTKSMLENQNRNLDPKVLGKIQELTIKIELMEKSSPAKKLLPQFFIEPV